MKKLQEACGISFRHSWYLWCPVTGDDRENSDANAREGVERSSSRSNDARREYPDGWVAAPSPPRKENGRLEPRREEDEKPKPLESPSSSEAKKNLGATTDAGNRSANRSAPAAAPARLGPPTDATTRSNAVSHEGNRRPAPRHAYGHRASVAPPGTDAYAARRGIASHASHADAPTTEAYVPGGHERHRSPADPGGHAEAVTVPSTAGRRSDEEEEDRIRC